jgi:hypothetical protein
MRGRGGFAASAQAFQPAGGVEIGRGQALRELLVAGARAEEEGDAIVGAGDDERRVGGAEALDNVTAEGVADQEGVVFARGLGVDQFLHPLAAGGGVVVEPLGDELEVNGVGRAGGSVADLAERDFASDDFEVARAHDKAELIAFGRPTDGLSEELTVMGVLVGKTVVAELDAGDPGGLVLIGPGDDGVAGGLLSFEEDMDVGSDIELAVGFVVDIEAGETPGDGMVRVGDFDTELDVVEVGGSGFFDAVLGAFFEEIPAAEDPAVFGPVLVIGKGMVKSDEAFAFGQTGKETGLGPIRDRLPHVVEDQDVVIRGWIALKPGVGGGMFDHLRAHVGERPEEFVELVGLKVVAADDDERAHRFGGRRDRKAQQGAKHEQEVTECVKPL